MSKWVRPFCAISSQWDLSVWLCGNMEETRLNLQVRQPQAVVLVHTLWYWLLRASKTRRLGTL